MSSVIDQGYSVSKATRRLSVERSVLDRWCRKHRQQVDGSPGRQLASEIECLTDYLSTLKL